MNPNRWHSIFRQYQITFVLIALICFTLFYWGLIYEYPAGVNSRNPVDRVFDSLGYSCHLLFFSFDTRPGAIVSDYHVRQALLYKPGDPYLTPYLKNQK